jgi:hypothetical protein
VLLIVPQKKKEDWFKALKTHKNWRPIRKFAKGNKLFSKPDGKAPLDDTLRKNLSGSI